jgi:hypothetical protein
MDRARGQLTGDRGYCGNDPARLKTALPLPPGMSVAMVLVNLGAAARQEGGVLAR